MQYTIETYHLSKCYGDVQAVQDVNLRVKQGEIYGFLGLNGAVKTTTIRMLLGMIHPSEGNVKVLGQALGPGGADRGRRLVTLSRVHQPIPN
jgi:ABC-type multidrug transport system ATPase subunit